MATYSTSLKLSYPAYGENGVHGFLTWGALVNSNFQFVEDKVSNSATIALTGVNVTLTDAQERCMYLNLTGTLVANVEVRTSGRKGFWFVNNATSGAFTATFKPTSGTGYAVPQGVNAILYCDGTNIFPINLTSYAGTSTEDKKISVGIGRSGNGNSYLDLVGDATYTTYGLRFIRTNTGANANSEIQHRGTGPLVVNANEGSISLQTAGVEKLGVSAAGLVNLPIGQIAFPATQNASTGANVLDDYEEGTWSPQMLVQTLSTGVVQSVTEGIYIKIGKIVTVFGAIVLSNKGAGTGVITIGNLPFSAVSTPTNAVYGSRGLMGAWGNIASITGPLYVGANAGATTLYALKWLAAAPDFLTNSANMANNSEMYFTCTYIAAA